MVKTVALLKRRSGISHDEFREYYENRHAPLATPYMAEAAYYRRHYLLPCANPTDCASDSREDFDAIMEIGFKNRGDLEATMQRLATPEVAKIVGNDELKLFDRDAIRVFVVETICESNL